MWILEKYLIIILLKTFKSSILNLQETFIR